MIDTRFVPLLLKLLQSRFAGKWFKKLSLEERKQILIRVWIGLNKGLNQRERFEIIAKSYDNRLMKNYPLLDSRFQARIFGLFNLVNEIRLIDGDLVETGVGRGLSLATLVYAVSFFSLNKIVYGFDSFAGFPNASQEDLGPRVQEVNKASGWETTSPEMVCSIFEFERQKPSTRSLLSEQDVCVKLVPGFFHETMPDSLPDKIALLHVDCDLYGSYKIVLENAVPRMSSGGIIVFDEYQDQCWPGAKKAVDEICTKYELQLSYFEPLQRFFTKIP